MKREEILQKVKEQLPERRFKHTLGVAETAVKLANKYGADADQAEIAAFLHDYCKYWDQERMRTIIEANDHNSADLLQYDKELWHGPVGAHVAREQFGIIDESTLNAIAYHTSGRPGMSLLEKIVFLADYIEPGRKFPGVEETRALAEKNLDQALLQAIGNTIASLVHRQKRIYPLTLATYNDFVKHSEGLREE